MADAKAAKKVNKDARDSLNGVAPEVALKLMRDMLLFRRFEEKAEEAYAIGKIGGFCHLHTGQEGSAAGSIGALRKDDYVIGTYREHTQALAKGITANAVMAELYGRKDGCSGGRGGSMHLFDAELCFMGAAASWAARFPPRPASASRSGTAARSGSRSASSARPRSTRVHSTSR